MKTRLFGLLADIICARNIVFVAMLAVGGLCIFMSASNTTAYLELTGMGHSIALMTGIALVIFSSTSATAAQLFISQKGLVKIFSVPFVVVGATVIIFSIFSTLSLNYNKFISSPAIQADIQEKIDKKRSELMAEMGGSGKQNASQWAMDNIDRLLDMAQESGESWNNSMRTILEMSTNLNANEQQIVEELYIETLPGTFFGFMLNLGDLEQKYFFDFFMIAIPAIFYDIIAPLAITVVLFLMGIKSGKDNGAGVVADVTTATLPPKPKGEPPDIKDLTTYIENAMQE
jgi:hypothetical protein